MRTLLTTGLVILAFPFCLGAFSFLVAFLGMGVVPADQRLAMNLLVFRQMVAAEDVSRESLLDSISNLTILTESYVVLAWILAGGLALVVGFLLPRFQLVGYLVMSLMAMSRIMVLSFDLQLPIWMPVAGVLGLGILAFLTASLTSRVRIMREDWLFQKLGMGKSSSDPAIPDAPEVGKYQRLFSIWNWLLILSVLGWIVFAVLEKPGPG